MAKRTTTDKATDRLRDGRDRGLIRISAKALGELDLPTFCVRCFWLKRKMRNKPPFRQPLPGVFSAIDSITQQVVHGYFEAHGHLPPWLAPLGDIVRDHEPPHSSRFKRVIEEHGILLINRLPVATLCEIPSVRSAVYRPRPTLSRESAVQQCCARSPFRPRTERSGAPASAYEHVACVQSHRRVGNPEVGSPLWTGLHPVLAT